MSTEWTAVEQEVLDGKHKLVTGIFSLAYLSWVCILGSIADTVVSFRSKRKSTRLNILFSLCVEGVLLRH